MFWSDLAFMPAEVLAWFAKKPSLKIGGVNGRSPRGMGGNMVKFKSNGSTSGICGQAKINH